MGRRNLEGPNVQVIQELNDTVAQNVCMLAQNARIFRYPHTWIRPYLLDR